MIYHVIGQLTRHRVRRKKEEIAPKTTAGGKGRREHHHQKIISYEHSPPVDAPILTKIQVVRILAIEKK